MTTNKERELAVPRWMADGIVNDYIKLIILPLSKQPPATHTIPYGPMDGVGGCHYAIVTPTGLGPLSSFPKPPATLKSPSGPRESQIAIRDRRGRPRANAVVEAVRLTRLHDICEQELFEAGVLYSDGWVPARKSYFPWMAGYHLGVFGSFVSRPSAYEAFTGQWNHDFANRDRARHSDLNPWTWAIRIKEVQALCKD